MIESRLRRLPRKPGVYLLKNQKGDIIYVGKAKALRQRLRSHFRPGRTEDIKHRVMMKKVADFEIIVTDSEVEALILEANLVQEHQPHYNINLKDDKSYPYIRITCETFPRVMVTRRVVRDGSRYFGPYTDVGNMRQLMSAIRRIFPVRTCQLRISEQSILKKSHKVCLNYHIGRCRGPCEGLISKEEYDWLVDQVQAFIQGRSTEVVAAFEKRMKILAGQRHFEEAAMMRDQIRSVSRFQERQKMVDGESASRDLIAVATDESDACGLVFHIRNGKVINRQHFYLDIREDLSDDLILPSFVKQFYLRTDEIPEEIYLSRPVEDTCLLEEWLSGKRGARVRLCFPQKGKKAHLISMAEENARLLLDERVHQKNGQAEWVAPSVKALQKELGLQHIPRVIEAFDISHIQGKAAVASMVSFENGRARKNAYRRYKIKTVTGVDDFASMSEVVRRRYRRLAAENRDMPDLILVDGGKGQLSSALTALKNLGFENQAVIGLAKRLEEIYMPGLPDPQTLSKSSPALRLLQRVRNEAHRFAIAYHRQARQKQMVRSVLDDIPGIGSKRRQALLKSFGSLAGIQNATVEQLAAVPGMNTKAAESVIIAFRNRPEGSG